MSADSDGIDKNLLEFARQVAAIPRQISEGVRGVDATPQPPAALDAAPPEPLAQPSETPPPRQVKPSDEPQTKNHAPATSNKKLRTSEELASLILSTLREVGDCPRKGFVVTIYGSNPWNALLTIRPEAGTRIDRTVWVTRVQDIAARLRTEFDISDDASSS